MRISYWSSDVCSSDLLRGLLRQWPKGLPGEALRIGATELLFLDAPGHAAVHSAVDIMAPGQTAMRGLVNAVLRKLSTEGAAQHGIDQRSEEHTSELQSLMRISYAVFCLKKKTEDNKPTEKRDEKNKQ